MYARRATGSVIIRRGTCVVNTVATTLPIVILLAVCDAHEFWLRPEFHAEAAALPTDPAHLRTSKRDAQIAQKETVDPYHPGLNLFSDSKRAIDVRRPYVSRESEARGVGARDCLFLVVEALDGQHRPENFLGHGARARIDTVEQRRQIVESARGFGWSFSAGQNLCAISHRVGDERMHPLAMCARNQRAVVGALGERVSNLEAWYLRREQLKKVGGNFSVDQQSRTCDARLPLAAVD